jgi:hypothetical protein
MPWSTCPNKTIVKSIPPKKKMEQDLAKVDNADADADADFMIRR